VLDQHAPNVRQVVRHQVERRDIAVAHLADRLVGRETGHGFFHRAYEAVQLTARPSQRVRLGPEAQAVVFDRGQTWQKLHEALGRLEAGDGVAPFAHGGDDRTSRSEVDTEAH